MIEIRAMPAIRRSTHPTCPACGFRVFNRRCTTCEKCRAVLPTSIAYTPAELDTMRRAEQVADDTRARRLAVAQAARSQRALRAARLDGASDVLGLAIDLTDLLDAGS